MLPPKAELETKAVLRKAIAANKALAELKGAGDLIPNQGVLINAVVLQEAKPSSEIENVVTTNDEFVGGGRGYMFVKRTYSEDMSNKFGFLDISQEHVQGVDMFLRYAGVRCGAIFKSRQIRLFSDWILESRHIKGAAAEYGNP